uniref:Uncharacterized protein n=1 Tax=Triticum urartu TaxID=4572 RepID=A0A8R7PWH4_TRIUA
MDDDQTRQDRRNRQVDQADASNAHAYKQMFFAKIQNSRCRQASDGLMTGDDR